MENRFPTSHMSVPFPGPLRLLLWRTGPGAGKLPAMAARDQTSSVRKVRGWGRFQSPTHSRKTRMNGAPGVLVRLCLAALTIAIGFADTATDRVSADRGAGRGRHDCKQEHHASIGTG